MIATIDEPLVTPLSPGCALMRLAQVGGVLKSQPHIARALPPNALEQAHDQREALLIALESGERETIQSALHAAQHYLCRLYEAVCRPGLWNEDEAPAVYAALRFPDPLQNRVQAVDVSTVLPTFVMPQRQVLTTLAFQDAVGATAYWLREIRVINGSPGEDAIVESYTPMFRRLRLSSGPHRLRIESRNASEFTISEEFEIQVPNASAMSAPGDSPSK